MRRCAVVGDVVRVVGTVILPGARLLLSIEGREEGGGEWAEITDRRGEDIADISIEVLLFAEV